MRVSVRLAAYAGESVPDIGADGRGEWDLAEETTLAGALARLGPMQERPALTLVNDRVVREAQRSDLRLADGDRLVVMPPIDGG